MIEGIGRYTSRIFSNSTRKPSAGKQNYKAKLWNTPVCQDVDVPERCCPYADRVRHLVSHVQTGVAYQSLAVAALQTLRSVTAQERLASNATISLAQGEKLDAMISDAESTARAIMQTLDPQGSHILSLSPEESPNGNEASWWYALTETIESIESGIKRILSLSASQPRGGAGRQLSAIVVRLLRSHHRELLAEADAWIS